MNLTLRIWRQQSANASGRFVNYQIKDVTPEMSFLEMLDALNEDLINRERASRCLRARLPGGDLRLVRVSDQRRGPWRPAWHHRLPTLDALLQG